MKPIRMLRGVMTVGFWTLISRVFGVLREVLILAWIGPGPVMDAFVAAFRLPNMFRRFFAEGAFNAAFVPIFSKKLQSDDNAEDFASDAMNGLALVLFILTGVALVFMPALVWLTAGGFAGDARFDMTIGFGRVVFPYIFFISLAALFSGALNASGRFAAAAAAPVLLNILVCLAMFWAAVVDRSVVLALIWCVPVAGVVQLALVWVATERAGLKIRPRWPRMTQDVRRLVAVALPAALAGGVMQINLLVGQQVASFFESAVGWLYAADRLYQLPLGVVGIAVGIVLLPDLARRLEARDVAGSQDAVSRAAEIALALTIPAAIALIVVPLPVVTVLFERGATTSADSAAIALAVAIYGAGLPAFVLQKVLQPLFFAREDTRTPFRYAIWAMAVNAALAIGLAPTLGWTASAIATTAAGWAMVWMLWRGTRTMGVMAQFDARFWDRIWRVVLAAVFMGLALWATRTAFPEVYYLAGWRYLALLALVSEGFIVYALAGNAIGAFRLSELRASFRRSS
jgi:putative peptidoglycan lipid II flippase